MVPYLVSLATTAGKDPVVGQQLEHVRAILICSGAILNSAPIVRKRHTPPQR